MSDPDQPPCKPVSNHPTGCQPLRLCLPFWANRPRIRKSCPDPSGDPGEGRSKRSRFPPFPLPESRHLASFASEAGISSSLIPPRYSARLDDYCRHHRSGGVVSRRSFTTVTLMQTSYRLSFKRVGV